jgi:hypothetical protein
MDSKQDSKVVRVEARADVMIEVMRVTYYRVPRDTSKEEVQALADQLYAGEWEDIDGYPVNLLDDPEEYEVLVEDDDGAGGGADIYLVRDAQGNLVEAARYGV